MRKLGVIAGGVLAAATLIGPLQGIAQAQTGKLVVIVEENETYGNIVGNSQAPYLNQLIAQGELFTNYAGGGSRQQPELPGHDERPDLREVPALAEHLPGHRRHRRRADVEGVHGVRCRATARTGTAPTCPAPVSRCTRPTMTRATPTRPTPRCSANDVPMTASTFNPANLPDLSYVVPNECDDMHTLPGSGQACPAYFGSNPGSSLINMGDNWLASVVPPLLAQPNVTVLITWDEGSMSTTPPEHVVALEAGAGVTPGSTDGTAYTHYGLEAGLYQYFGLGTAPGNGATATPLPIPSPTPPSPPAVSSVSPASGWPRVRGDDQRQRLHRGHRSDLQRHCRDVHRHLRQPDQRHRPEPRHLRPRRGDHPGRHRNQSGLVHRHRAARTGHHHRLAVVGRGRLSRYDQRQRRSPVPPR